MPTSRTTKRLVRPARRTGPAPRTGAVVAKRQPKPAKPAPKKKKAAKATPSQMLPGWEQVASAVNNRRKATPAPLEEKTWLAISTPKFVLGLLAVVAVFTVYVGHVHATQDLLAAVQAERRANHRLHLQYNRLKGDFDRATGPALIYERARALGLEEGTTFGPTIQVEPTQVLR